MTLTSVHVKTNGLCLLQDEGRYGYQSEGVPVAGAWDMFTYRSLNMLLFNNADTNAPVFELLAGTMVARSSHETLHVAVAGDDVEVLVDGARQAKDTVFSIYPHSVMTVKNASGFPAYIMIAGMQVEERTLGSVSYDSFSLIHQQPNLTEGVLFNVENVPCHPGRFLKPYDYSVRKLRFVPHPHNSVEELVWEVSSNTRSGVRFNHVAVGTASGLNTSNPVTVGAIQITPDGTPIILGVDGGTVGGYGTIGAVIAADLHKLPYVNSAVRMHPVTVEEAVKAYETQIAELRSRVFPLEHFHGNIVSYVEL